MKTWASCRSILRSSGKIYIDGLRATLAGTNTNFLSCLKGYSGFILSVLDCTSSGSLGNMLNNLVQNQVWGLIDPYNIVHLDVEENVTFHILVQKFSFIYY